MLAVLAVLLSRQPEAIKVELKSELGIAILYLIIPS